jgi:hypothetical protein
MAVARLASISTRGQRLLARRPTAAIGRRDEDAVVTGGQPQQWTIVVLCISFLRALNR